jgi:hypothetical protein
MASTTHTFWFSQDRGKSSLDEGGSSKRLHYTPFLCQSEHAILAIYTDHSLTLGQP